MTEDAQADVGEDRSTSSPLRRERPGVITAMRLVLFFVAGLLAVGGGLAVVSETPVRASVDALAYWAGVVGIVVAFRAIGRRERWGIWFGTAVLVEMFAAGIWQMVAPDRPGTFTIPLGSIVAGIMLLGLARSLDVILAFAVGPAPVRPALAIALVVALVAPLIAPPVMAGIADPTQVTAGDLRLQLSVSCRASSADPTLQTVTARTTIVWARHDILPVGLSGLSGGPRDHDGLLAEATNGVVAAGDSPDVQGWALGEWPAPEPWFEPGFEWGPPANGTVTLTGPPSDAPLTSIPSNGPQVRGIAAITPELMTVGRPYDVAWQFVGSLPWPTVRVRYVHEYRFAVDALAGCGETVAGHLVSP